MNIPYVSLTLTRQHVTELVRSPRVAVALGRSRKHPQRSIAPNMADFSVPSVPLIPTTALTLPISEPTLLADPATIAQTRQ